VPASVLPWFGVRAMMHGQGLGSKLMTACRATVDAVGVPAYFETPDPRIIAFYKRRGFEAAGAANARSCCNEGVIVEHG
jgi:predicted N-acetyltransferase YhbS